MSWRSVPDSRVFTLSLSCKRAKCISFLSNRLLTLCQKQPGCTYVVPNLELGVLLPCAATHLLISQQLPHSFLSRKTSMRGQKHRGCGTSQGMEKLYLRTL